MMSLRISWIICLLLFGCQSNQKTVDNAPLLDLSYNRSLFQYHPYQKSDTLLSIADAYDVSMDEIMRANNLKKDQAIQSGRVLKIPQQIVDSKHASVQSKNKPMLIKGWSSPVKAVHNTVRDAQHGGWMIYPKVVANVRAVANGKVVYVGKRTKDLGVQIILQHPANQSTMYALMGDVVVKKGQFVKKGQRLGSASIGKQMKPNVYFDRIKT